MSNRFSTNAATKLRQAIIQAGGVEVFAIGDVEFGSVVRLTVTCRGLKDQVPALLERPRWGQVVIHNHPSGDLRPSQADLHLAGIYGDNGVGVVIVDSQVSRSNWVVEPSTERRVELKPNEVETFFRDTLAAKLERYETREPQIAMAKEVAECLSTENPLVVEAGTGTGKSLGYLIPAAMWAKANDAKVVISTYTKALQNQLIQSDIPILKAAGMEVRVAILQGRNNYLCKRRLANVDLEDKDSAAEQRAEIDTLLEWTENTNVGTRSDLPVPIQAELWERVESDSDLTMRLQCPHYAKCHYYEARRAASAAHIVVVNHALLMADLALRESIGHGILPKYDRIILDEAHHLEQAATGSMGRKLSERAIKRAITPLLTSKRRRGALEKLQSEPVLRAVSMFGEDQSTLCTLLQHTHSQLHAVRELSAQNLKELVTCMPEDGTPLRITREVATTRKWTHRAEPCLIEILESLRQVTHTMSQIQSMFPDTTQDNPATQPLLDLNRALNRLSGHMEMIASFLNEPPEMCRWLDRQRTRGKLKTATLHLAPVSVRQFLKKVLWESIPGTTATSATLSVGRNFDWWCKRNGLMESATGAHPSPFQHAEQAILALPRDLPEPNHPDFMPATGRAVLESVRLSQGGTFVLCTSYQAIEYYKGVLESNLPTGWPVLTQSKQGKGRLLQRFKENPRSVLIGTDSFWEGVDVRGMGLRQVIIPRLPFRVPTDPLQEAQYEEETKRGRDPFRSLSLPAAIIKLRQGYGRLIRSQEDRGVVLILDKRIHQRGYGPVMLHSLPPARRLKLPWNRLKTALKTFWDQALPNDLLQRQPDA
jgi:ATP-dependent DNA helicase DinG